MARITRREFVVTGAAAGLAATAPRPAFGAAPAVLTRQPIRPVVIASANGNRFRNGGTETCVELAFRRITAGDDVLDALVAGVNIVELDPEDASVGYGGRPNADGVVQLDSCCMHGPKRRAGGVAALEGVRTPSNVAQAVMDQTDHHLLVGPGAQRFARNMGFEIEDDLNTDRSRQMWLRWKRRTDPGHYLDPERADARRDGLSDDEVDERYGTINCDGISPDGQICGVTTTSGLAWKIPGRVGDSPILGAGLYLDNAVGAVGSTGRGEANLYNLTSFLIVEYLRQGMGPKDAGLAGLRRIQENTVERRLHMREWVQVFRHRPRQSIRPHEIRAQRDRWLTEPRTDQRGRPRPPYAAGSVNKRLRALSNLWRVLDGRHAPNPVREVPEADEIEGAPRALPYPVIRAILDAMPDCQTKARLAVLAWTGLAHVQMSGLRPEDVDWEGRSLWIRGRRKGASGKVRKGHRKPITDEAIAELRRFDELDCWGGFSQGSMRNSLARACRRVERRCKTDGVEVDLSRVRPYDFRHSYATAILASTQDLRTTQRLMLHSSIQTTERYARAAVDPMLVAALERFSDYVTNT